LWGTSRFYSIWFPAAGVRFAALWLLGARAAPLLALVELAGLALVGVVGQLDFGEPLIIGSIVAPCLAYGAALGLCRRMPFKSSTLTESSLRFGTAAILAPMLAFAASAPWHIAGHDPAFGGSFSSILATAAVFIVGDLLGILLVAPPILRGIELVRERRRPELGPWTQWAATAALLLVALGIVVAIEVAGFGIRLAPLIFAVGAVGVIYGRGAAWAAVLTTSAAVLWLTAAARFETHDLQIHLQLAVVAVMGIVAGVYTDDQRKMRDELRRRDAALLHAERLKTLRAMSLAVIHELSQPLSTLSIETRYLAKLSNDDASDPTELRTVSRLIAEKTENLADMLRRLRTFGAPAGQVPLLADVDSLVRDAVAIVALEAREAGVRIEPRLQDGLALVGHRVELQQALANLLRNAIAASPGGTVQIIAEGDRRSLRIDVVNTPGPDSGDRKGMGIGKLIVAAIAEMHGGRLAEHQSSRGERTTSLFLPSESGAANP
jgi:signal transduction histidine kinase